MAYTKTQTNQKLALFRRRQKINLPWTYASKYHSTLKSRTGDRNPRWRKQVATRQNATTPLSGEVSEVFLTPGWAQCDWKQPGDATVYRSEYYGDIAGYQSSGYSSVPTDKDAEAQRRATLKAYAEIRSLQRSFQGGVFFGELGETLKMLRRPAAALRDKLSRNYLNALAKRKKRDPLGWTKAIAGTWLEQAFGWKPLLMDLEDAMTAYNNLLTRELEQPVKLFRVSASADADNLKPTLASIAPIAGSNLRCVEVNHVRARAVCVVRGAVKRQVEMTTVDKLKLFGLSPGEFIPTAWELLPWSFLVDYFVNIGDILEAATTDTSNVAWTSRTTIRESTRTFNVYPDPLETKRLYGVNFVGLRGAGSLCRNKRRYFVREPAWALAVPPLSFTYPGSGSQKWINMTALWAQADAVSTQRLLRPIGRWV